MLRAAPLAGGEWCPLQCALLLMARSMEAAQQHAHRTAHVRMRLAIGCEAAIGRKAAIGCDAAIGRNAAIGCKAAIGRNAAAGSCTAACDGVTHGVTAARAWRDAQ